MLDVPGLQYIGHVAVFYVPEVKLDVPELGSLDPRTLIHDFLMDQYDAYTVETSEMHGFWRRGGLVHHMDQYDAYAVETSETHGFWRRGGLVHHDRSVRYEVSFAGPEKVPAFVRFLSDLCFLMNEQAIYLTMGGKSYLVEPRGDA